MVFKGDQSFNPFSLKGIHFGSRDFDFSSCHIRAQSQDFTHLDVNSIHLEVVRNRSLSCLVHRRPRVSSSVSGVTCPPTRASFVPELYRTGRGLL
ncbi:hypothetical protein MTR_7g010290 [Medicago truncatula]|uniref:Uncharacterized protein n=1 Tax=Medicago truncatula TaxID=3880 RepID=A2Q1B9_MEDTR|nr:hypothetical protein MtrDRAFT_AC148762g26v2 [Medicago truncatula]ABN08929.1 hypothetical protein MtrDRAFT_AC166313g21v2 [Medicago truncatula]AES77410.1 hypothetical protein MTR_7g010290 [Medicago truncatula]